MFCLIGMDLICHSDVDSPSRHESCGFNVYVVCKRVLHGHLMSVTSGQCDVHRVAVVDHSK